MDKDENNIKCDNCGDLNIADSYSDICIKCFHKNEEYIKRETIKQVLSKIDTFDFSKYSMCVNPIQEKKNIRQLKEELKKELMK